jgi:hypothetical protein
LPDGVEPRYRGGLSFKLFHGRLFPCDYSIRRDRREYLTDIASMDDLRSYSTRDSQVCQ